MCFGSRENVAVLLPLLAKERVGGEVSARLRPHLRLPVQRAPAFARRGGENDTSETAPHFRHVSKSRARLAHPAFDSSSHCAHETNTCERVLERFARQFSSAICIAFFRTVFYNRNFRRRFSSAFERRSTSVSRAQRRRQRAVFRRLRIGCGERKRTLGIGRAHRRRSARSALATSHRREATGAAARAVASARVVVAGAQSWRVARALHLAAVGRLERSLAQQRPRFAHRNRRATRPGGAASDIAARPRSDSRAPRRSRRIGHARIRFRNGCASTRPL